MEGMTMTPVPDLTPVFNPYPLHIWDVHDPQWYYRPDMEEWLRSHGVNPDDCWRYEIFKADTLCAKVYEHPQDPETGRHIVNWETGQSWTETRMIPVSCYPPTWYPHQIQTQKEMTS